MQDGQASPPPLSPPVLKESARMSTQVCLSPVTNLRVNKAPPLDKKFKKPPPNKKRRRPSKDHLKQMAALSEDGRLM